MLCIANIVAVDHGYGRPAKSLSKSDLHLALQVCFSICFTISTHFISHRNNRCSISTKSSTNSP